eukprot:m.450452 g.450452  ORF g.450452 m.450452 type:complete len:411 (+) comp20320_c5_seq7:827-2059(+)
MALAPVATKRSTNVPLRFSYHTKAFLSASAAATSGSPSLFRSPTARPWRPSAWSVISTVSNSPRPMLLALYHTISPLPTAPTTASGAPSASMSAMATVTGALLVLLVMLTGSKFCWPSLMYQTAWLANEKMVSTSRAPSPLTSPVARSQIPGPVATTLCTENPGVHPVRHGCCVVVVVVVVSLVVVVVVVVEVVALVDVVVVVAVVAVVTVVTDVVAVVVVVVVLLVVVVVVCVVAVVAVVTVVLVAVVSVVSVVAVTVVAVVVVVCVVLVVVVVVSDVVVVVVVTEVVVVAVVAVVADTVVVAAVADPRMSTLSMRHVPNSEAASNAYRRNVTGTSRAANAACGRSTSSDCHSMSAGMAALPSGVKNASTLDLSCQCNGPTGMAERLWSNENDISCMVTPGWGVTVTSK